MSVPGGAEFTSLPQILAPLISTVRRMGSKLIEGAPIEFIYLEIILSIFLFLSYKTEQISPCAPAWEPAFFQPHYFVGYLYTWDRKERAGLLKDTATVITCTRQLQGGKICFRQAWFWKKPFIYPRDNISCFTVTAIGMKTPGLILITKV